MARSHRDLIVWQKAMDLVVQVYWLTSRFPASERQTLTDQLKRAVVSVPANIAEGSGRGSVRDYARFVSIARGSLMETETLIMLALRLGFVGHNETDEILGLLSEVSRMLAVLRTRLLDDS